MCSSGRSIGIVSWPDYFSSVCGKLVLERDYHGEALIYSGAGVQTSEYGGTVTCIAGFVPSQGIEEFIIKPSVGASFKLLLAIYHLYLYAAKYEYNNTKYTQYPR